MPLRGILRAFGAATLLLALLVPSSAHAHETATGAEHTLTFSRIGTIERFSGELASSKAACESKRTVKLFRITETKPNDRIDDGDLKTNANGKWTLELSGLPTFDPGDYKAIAPKTVVKKPGHKHVCKGAKSPLRTVEAAADGDEDGWPDEQDCAPEFANPPEATVCYGPATLYEMNQGFFNAGSNVFVPEIALTAVSSDQTSAWAQVPTGSPQWIGAEYSGVRLDIENVSLSISPGDQFTVLGRITDDGAIRVHGIDYTGPAVPAPTPHLLTSTEHNSNAAAYNGVLVKIEKARLDAVSSNSWQMHDGFTIDGLINSLPPHLKGTWFASVTGIMDTRGTIPGVLPRADDDLTLSATVNETDEAREADYCSLVQPTTMESEAGTMTDAIYAQIYEAGVTEPLGEPSDVIAEFGYGPSNGDPVLSAANWTFAPGDFFVQQGNNDEYFGYMVAPDTPGTYRYTARVSLDGGASFTYCDTDGAGSASGSAFSAANTGTWTVIPSS